MKVLIVCFGNDPAAAETLASAAAGLSERGDRTALVVGGCGDGCGASLNCSSMIEMVFERETDIGDPFVCGNAVADAAGAVQADLLLFPAGTAGDDLAARTAVALGADCMLGASLVYAENGGIFIKKPVYSMNLQAVFQQTAFPFAVSLYESGARTDWEPEAARVTTVKIPHEKNPWMTVESDEPVRQGNSLKSAELVLAVGRGACGAETCGTIGALAEQMGGELGGTRPAVCSGRLPVERMIGSSAAILSPKVCMAFGVSGAAPFMAGVEKSGLLIAVNKDPHALIFDNCDVGIVDDCRAVSRALTKLCSERRGADHE